MSDETNSARYSPVQLRIVRGEPSDEEIAALTAVVVGLAGAESTRVRSPESSGHSAWGNPALRLRTPLHPGSGAWRVSALPH